MFSDIIDLNCSLEYDPSSPDEDHDELFRIDLLRIFRMQTYDNDLIIDKINDLFNVVKNHKRYSKKLASIFKENAKILFFDDEQIGFMLMFNFHLLTETYLLLQMMEFATDEEWRKIETNNIFSNIKHEDNAYDSTESQQNAA